MSTAPCSWSTILHQAIHQPGVIAAAYRLFWNYSPGNQLLALFQCHWRKIQPGPINTYPGWKSLGRNVRLREKALSLCMPVTCKRPSDSAITSDGNGDAANEPQTVTRFIYRPRWFVLCQTEGAEYVPNEIPDWSEELALRTLGVERIAFTLTDGNAQGFAEGKRFAVSPIAFTPQRTLFHELAHIVLGHTDRDSAERPEMAVREVEAECVALICSESLGLDTAAYSRGYIQHWLQEQPIPERSVPRIFGAAGRILRAGRPDMPRGELA